MGLGEHLVLITGIDCGLTTFTSPKWVNWLNPLLFIFTLEIVTIISDPELQTENFYKTRNRTIIWKKNTSKTKLCYLANEDQLPSNFHETSGFLPDELIIFLVPVIVQPHEALSKLGSFFLCNLSVDGWLMIFSQSYAFQGKNFGQDVAFLDTAVIIPAGQY